MNQYFYGLTGEVITPDNPFYHSARQEWNRAIQRFPLAIVYCYNKFDVSHAVIWARQHCVPIRIRSGGHNYEGFSTGNGVLVIDISRMNHIGIQKGFLFLEGGVKNEQLYDFIGPLGYPFPGGTCPTVGVSGYFTGGGWGLSCRLFGLGCDSLVELELVDGDGRIIRANARENPDLFWACRGAGGGNFGIVASMVFRLPEKVERVTYFEFYYPNTDLEKQATFLKAWQSWLPGLDVRMSLQANVYWHVTDGYAIYGRGLFYGTEAEARRLLLPILSLGGVQTAFKVLSFYEAIKLIGAQYPSSEKFQTAGRFVTEQLTDLEIERAASLIREVPQGSVYSALNLYSLGGKIKALNPRATAFFYRDAEYILAIQTVWEEDQYAEGNRQWLARRFPYVESITRGSYINFPYLGTANYMNAYYGGNANALRAVKYRYDPYNIFHFPQSIR